MPSSSSHFFTSLFCWRSSGSAGPEALFLGSSWHKSQIPAWGRCVKQQQAAGMENWLWMYCFLVTTLASLSSCCGTSMHCSCLWTRVGFAWICTWCGQDGWEQWLGWELSARTLTRKFISFSSTLSLLELNSILLRGLHAVTGITTTQNLGENPF